MKNIIDNYWVWRCINLLIIFIHKNLRLDSAMWIHVIMTSGKVLSISDVPLFDLRMNQKNACPGKDLAWKREFLEMTRAILRYAPWVYRDEIKNLEYMLGLFSFSPWLYWLASEFMEYLRMKLASYKFQFYLYIPLKNMSKWYQFCEHSSFLNFNDQFAALDTCWKTKITLILENTLSFPLYS